MVIDVLSTYTEWMTIDTLVGRVQLHQPALSDSAIERAARRLISEGRIQTRKIEGLTGPTLLVYSDEWSVYAS